ncbi:hypothetical protein JCM3770_001182 [Rhodotorula araucariae]
MLTGLSLPWSPSPAPASPAASLRRPDSPPPGAASSTPSASSRWIDACSKLDATNPLAVGIGTAALLGVGTRIWHRYGRRIRTVDDLTTADYSPKTLRGTVTSVGDADGFRFFHRPLLRPWLTPPSNKTALKGQTLSVRLAGVDAPEMAHFGKAAQPFSNEAFALLTRTISGRRIKVEIFQKDRYGRAVGMAYVRRFPSLRRKNVSELLLQAGLATVYEQGGAVHAGRLDKMRELEATARARRLGMWSQSAKDFESPADYKARLRGE